MKKIMLIIYCFLVIFFCLSYLLIDKYSKVNTIKEIEKMIMIDVKGAVNNPGVKKIKFNSTVMDAINISGGLLDNADTSVLNLSKKVNDEDVIIVYTIDEVNDINNPENVKIIEKECVCPIAINNACSNINFSNITLDNNKISINSASKEELMTLSGIGESKAETIIKYREANLFKTIDEITNVKGIGKSIFEKIKDYITL